MKYDVVIIGSGLGGLECASILSRNGRRVLLLESNAQTGGCMQSYKRHGMAFDTGLHYVGGLGEGESLYAAFRYLGLLELPWQRLDDEFDKITIGERTFSFSQGFEPFVEGLAKDFPSERDALCRYAALLQESAKEQLRPLNPSGDAAEIPELMESSAWQYLEQNFHDPCRRNELSGTSLKLELRKVSLPLFTFLHAHSSFVESSWRLKGDGSLLVESLAGNIRSHGGEIVRNAAVLQLVEEEGRLTKALCSNGETYEGEVFISDIHPNLTCNLVKDSQRLKGSFRKRIGRLENTFGMFSVSLRLKPACLRYFNYNQFIYAQPNVWDFYLADGPVSGVMVSCRVPEDTSGYAQQVDLLTPMTWNKCGAWTETSVGKRGEEYESMKRRVADECIALAEKVIPGLHDMVAESYISTPLTYRDYTHTPEGSAYGLRKDFNTPLTTFISPRTPIPNLLLTGQNLMLHGVHGVTMTALFTCAEVLGKEQIWNIVKN